jgi:hypothetical protein
VRFQSQYPGTITTDTALGDLGKPLQELEFILQTTAYALTMADIKMVTDYQYAGSTETFLYIITSVKTLQANFGGFNHYQTILIRIKSTDMNVYKYCRIDDTPNTALVDSYTYDLQMTPNFIWSFARVWNSTTSKYYPSIFKYDTGFTLSAQIQA